MSSIREQYRMSKKRWKSMVQKVADDSLEIMKNKYMKTYLIEKAETIISTWKVVADSTNEALYAVEKETDKAEFIGQIGPRIGLEFISETKD